MSDENEPTYERLCKIADKTAVKYNERGYDARVLKFPVSSRVFLVIDVVGDDNGQTQ